MFAVLTNFFTIWNQNIDIRLRGLSKKYYGLYDGNIIEDEIEKMAAWPNREEPPHPEWASTRNVEDNPETFRTIDPIPLRPRGDDESAADASLHNLADNAAGELLELDTGVDRNLYIFNSLALSQWLAALHDRAQACGKVKGHFEWEYFQTNIFNFQRRGAYDKANNYSTFQFSAFSDSWNEWVHSLGSTNPEVTYKTAEYLKESYKTMKSRGVQDSTLRQHI